MQTDMARVQVWLEPEQRAALAEIAQTEGRSLSGVVRDMISQQLEQRRRAHEADVEEYLATLERIRQHREEILLERGGQPIQMDIVGAINEMREERDAENLARLNWTGD